MKKQKKQKIPLYRYNISIFQKFENWLNKVTVCKILGHRFWRWNSEYDLPPDELLVKETTYKSFFCSRCWEEKE